MVQVALTFHVGIQVTLDVFSMSIYSRYLDSDTVLKTNYYFIKYLAVIELTLDKLKLYPANTHLRGAMGADNRVPGQGQ